MKLLAKLLTLGSHRVAVGEDVNIVRQPFDFRPH